MTGLLLGAEVLIILAASGLLTLLLLDAIAQFDNALSGLCSITEDKF